METILIEKDITVFYIAASSFPNGVLEAHQKLHSLIPYSSSRKYYGISRPENGVIQYKAAAEELHPGEGEKHNCKTLTLKKGKYAGILIKDFMKDIPAIEKAFLRLIALPNIDPEGYCVEWYLNDTDVSCMIRLKD